MSLSNLPPGLSTGVDYSAAEVTCPNDHHWIQHVTRERDTNAAYPLDGEEVCPVCGLEPDPTQDRPFYEDEGPDPDRQRDEAWDRENLP